MSKGNRNRTLRNERRTSQMKEQNVNMEEMRLKRIANHPLDIKGNYIVMDNLEGGTIKVFLHTDEDYALNIQWDGNTAFIKGATLVGKISISYMVEEDAVVVEDIYYKEGYTELRGAMFNQVLDFAVFYNYENMALDNSVVPEWLAEIGKDE